MKNLIATVSGIDSCQNLHIVKFDLNGQALKMMSLDLNSKIRVGKKVLLGCKPSSVAIAKDFNGMVSYSNQIPSKIEEIETGKLLCNLRLKFGDSFLESLITKDSMEKMGLKKGDLVTAFIKASEISILEVFND